MFVVLVGLFVTEIPSPAWAIANWSIVSSPNAKTGNELQAVSCASTTSCVAVGEDDKSGVPEEALAESWNGKTWTIRSSPNMQKSDSDLLGVSCASANSCEAVGWYTNSTGDDRALAESWNGKTWAIRSSPNPETAAAVVLDGVSCVSANSCEAVGLYISPGNGGLTLTESWNGKTWVIQSSPNPEPAAGDVLNGVSCVSATSCEAVGYSIVPDSGNDLILIESWNGSTWTIQSSPNPETTAREALDAVSCVSATSCQSVGSYGEVNDQTLTESWNGSTWTIQSSPNNGRSDALSGVSCVSSSCTAVGYYDNSPQQLTLVESYH